jgi:hypothetical protein
MIRGGIARLSIEHGIGSKECARKLFDVAIRRLELPHFDPWLHNELSVTLTNDPCKQAAASTLARAPFFLEALAGVLIRIGWAPIEAAASVTHRLHSLAAKQRKVFRSAHNSQRTFEFIQAQC